MRVLLTGASGFIGTALVEALRSRGDEVLALTRSRSSATARQRLGRPGVRVLEWTGGGTTEAWWSELSSVDAVVNLAGEPVIGRRWSPEQKESIRLSRVRATGAVVGAIRSSSPRPAVLVSASAIGYYGFHGEEELTEEAPAGSDFLATVCRDWEAAARGVEDVGVRLVCPRIGVVFGREGGA